MWARTGSSLRALSAMPLIQSGLSLVTSSIVSSGLGFLFWILAARNYSSAEIGIGSAVITAMILISDVSHLGLRTGLVRFVPMAGLDAGSLIMRAYSIGMAVAGLGALVFLAGLAWWVPELQLLRDNYLYGALFVLATMFWVVFQMTDSVLLGLRLAPWVPVENGIFGLLKILLLFPLAGLAGQAAQLGVFLAWSLPVFVVVVAVTAAMARVLRARAADAGGSGAFTRGPSLIAVGGIMRYSLVDWTATVSRSAVIGLLPIFVLQAEGSSISAYFAIAWTIAYSVHMLSANVADALLAEASYDRANVDRHTLHSGLLSLTISAPVVLVAVVAAPWVLRAFGQEYADGATDVLRLLLISSIPNIVTRTYVGRLRAQGRMRAVFTFEAFLSLAVLISGWVLLQAMGIVGVGLAWLVVLTLAALWVVGVESAGWWGPRLEQRRPRRPDGAGPAPDPVRPRRSQPALDTAVNEVLGTRYTSLPSWHRLQVDDHSQTVRVAGHEGRPPLVMELAATPWGAEAMSRRVAAVTAMSDLTGLAPFRALVPFPIEHSTAVGSEYLIESALSGTPGDVAVRTTDPQPLAAAMLEAMGQLHEATAGWMDFGVDELDRWVARPLKTLGDGANLAPETVVALGRRICSGLDGRRVPAARIHGNLTLAKARFDPTTHRLTGLVDWEWSTQGPLFLDWCTLSLSTMAIEAGEEVGAVVNRLLDQPDSFLAHHVLTGRVLPGIDTGALILLTWVHTLVPSVWAAPPEGPTRLWTGSNVEPVVHRFLQADEVFQP